MQNFTPTIGANTKCEKNHSVLNGTGTSRNPQSTPRKPVDSERKAANAHRSPSLVLPAMRSQIVGSVRAGRSVAQVAKEFNVTQACVLELALRAAVRDFDFRLERLEDATLPTRPSAVRVA